MPFPHKQQRITIKNRKPLTSSTNTRDSLVRKQKSYSKKQNTSNIVTQASMNRSIAAIKSRQQTQQQTSKIKQSVFMDKYYEKYYKKQRKQQFPNISIIEQKQSILSNNQQNSLDSLNNFIIQGNGRHDNSVIQKSNQDSSYDQSGIEDWTMLQNEYNKIVNKNNEYSEQSEYLQIINEIKYNENVWKNENIDENMLPILNVTQKITRLKEQINKLKIVNNKKTIHQQSSQVLQNMRVSQSYNQQKSSTFNQKSIQFKNSNQILKHSNQILKNSNQILRKSQTNLHKQEYIHSNISKLRLKISQQSNKNHHISDRLLEHLSQQDNKFIQQQSPSHHYQETQKDHYLQTEKDHYLQTEKDHYLQTEKDQDQFMKFMDKKYSEDNQPNLSLNNISNIMRVRPKQHHNKSIENQNQIKQKQDDQVVAMLENQLRGKQIPQIPQTQQTQILLKQSRDNLCLNDLQGDIQNNIQTSQIQEETSDQNKKNFFIALQARQKWIKSLDKSQKWKSAELALLSKMKKILHNPYIQFPQD